LFSNFSFSFFRYKKRKIITPQSYLKNDGLKIKILDNWAARYLSLDPSSKELANPWLQPSSYPINVWFFAVRDFFKKKKSSPILSPLTAYSSAPSPSPEEPLWTSALQLNQEFCNFEAAKKIKSFGQSAGKKEVELICGAGRTRGKRNYMEDVDFAFSSIKISDKSSVSLFGGEIFDFQLF
jgi:hypothetical protein